MINPAIINLAIVLAPIWIMGMAILINSIYGAFR